MTVQDAPAPGAPHPTDLARAAWEAVVGQEHLGPWFVVTPEAVAAFEVASCFEDTDEPDEYPDGLVEGFHLLALLDQFGRCVPVETSGHLAWNYGLNRVRFITPVHVNRPLRLRATVTDVTAKGPEAFLVTVAYSAQLEGATRPAFTAEMVAYHELLDDEPDPAP